MTHIGIKEILKSSGSIRIKAIKLADYILGSLLAALVRPRPEKKIEGEIRSILVIRPGGIGDAIFLLPFLRLLKERRPEIAVDILAEKRNAPVFLSQPGLVRKIYCYDDFHSFFSLFTSHGPRATRHYQVIIDSEQWHYLSALVAYFLKPAVSIGFTTRPLRAKLFNKKIPYDIHAYELENFRALFAAVIPEAKNINSLAGSFALEEKPLLPDGVAIPGKSAALFLGSSLPAKQLDRQNSAELIRSLLEKDYAVILLGGKDYFSEAEAICRDVNSSKLLNLAGKTSLTQTADIIKQTGLFVGTDSGILHLADAVGHPRIIAIFTASDSQKWGPRPPHQIVQLELPCRPCSLFSYTIPTCQNAYPCMQNLDRNILASAIEKQL